MSIRRLVVLGLVPGLFLLAGCSKKERRVVVEEPTAEAEQQAESKARGFTKDKIFLGMCSAFQGPIAGIGIEPYRGFMSYVLETNATGGVNGRTIEVTPEDTGYNAAKVTDCVQRQGPESLAFVGSSGVPIPMGASAALEKLNNDSFMLGWIASPSLFRNPTETRASLAARLTTGARAILKTLYEEGGARKYGILIEGNDTGVLISAGTRTALSERGLKPVIEITVPESARFDAASFTEQVNQMKAAGVDGVLVAATYQKAAIFTRDAREAGWNVGVGHIANPDTAFRLLAGHEKKTGKRVTNAFIGILWEPPVEDTTFPVVVEHRTLFAKRNPRLPDNLVDPNYRYLPAPSSASLQGFVSGKVMVEALRRAGPEPTRTKLLAAVQSIKDFDVGGVKVTYGDPNKPELEPVWIAGASASVAGAVPITDIKKYLTSALDASGAPYATITPASSASSKVLLPAPKPVATR